MVWFYIGCMFPLSHPCLRLVSIMALQAASVIALVFSILLIIASRFRYGNSNKKKPKPPHPPSWPIIGHGHLLDKNQPMHRFLSSLSQRYGPIIQLKFGLRPVLVISSSELAKECLKKNDRSFASRPSLLSGKHMGYDCKVMVSLPYGPYLRAIRKICNQHLFTPTTMESLKHVRVEEVSIWIRSLFENSHRQVNMKSRLGELLFNIMLGMIAGRKRMSRDSEEAARFKRLVEESFVLTVRFLVGDYVPFLRWVDRDIQEAMKNVFKKVDVFMTELVNDHRHRRRTQAGYTDEDLIDVLISATDNREIPSDNNDITVKATAYGLIAPGIDTSSVTMEWALAALLRQPHILRKAQQELDAHIGQDRLVEESDLHKLKYLEAIVKETLRLYPAAPILIPRESIEACTVGGYHVPAGTMVILNAWTIHRDPAVWERPTEFDPERFLKSGKVIDVRGQNFEMIPFGSGRRICPGMSLGLCLVAYTLARLLQSFEWSLPEGTVIDMTEEVGLSMPKAVPLEVIIKPRLPLHLYY